MYLLKVRYICTLESCSIQCNITPPIWAKDKWTDSELCEGLKCCGVVQLHSMVDNLKNRRLQAADIKTFLGLLKGSTQGRSRVL